MRTPLRPIARRCLQGVLRLRGVFAKREVSATLRMTMLFWELEARS